MNKRDLSISMERGNLIALLLAVPIAIVQFLPFALFRQREIVITFDVLLIVLVGTLISIVIHEILHALTWIVAGRLPRSAVKFGIHRRTLSPYTHLKVPVRVNVYRLGTLMPGFVLGILPYVVALITGHVPLFMLSVLNTLSALGDGIILWLLRRVPPTVQVEDHPNRIGCYVIESDPM